MDAEHADGSVRLQDRRLRIRYRRTRIASIESQAEPQPSPIGVFYVHRLATSALRFLLRGAAGRCWRGRRQARVAAHASGATPWHKRVYGARFGCDQRLRCVYPCFIWVKYLLLLPHHGGHASQTEDSERPAAWGLLPNK